MDVRSTGPWMEFLGDRELTTAFGGMLLPLTDHRRALLGCELLPHQQSLRYNRHHAPYSEGERRCRHLTMRRIEINKIAQFERQLEIDTEKESRLHHIT